MKNHIDLLNCFGDMHLIMYLIYLLESQLYKKHGEKSIQSFHRRIWGFNRNGKRVDSEKLEPISKKMCVYMISKKRD